MKKDKKNNEAKANITRRMNALNCMGNSTASANDCTGLIPGNNDTEAAAEFYEDMVDYLPHGVIPEDKYGD